MDDSVVVSHDDAIRSFYELFQDTFEYYTLPPYMKMSHVVQELRTIVRRPHVCMYDGLLGFPNDAGEWCERIAAHAGTARAEGSDMFIPVRLEHWLVRHLVTIRLRVGARAVTYYDPRGTGYEGEMRTVVGLTEHGVPVTVAQLFAMLRGALPDWSFASVGVWHQGLWSPLSCGRWNLQYINECLSDRVPPDEPHPPSL